ncbi:hypothetical protein M3J09_011987 [Ascochyta lentis]
MLRRFVVVRIHQVNSALAYISGVDDSGVAASIYTHHHITQTTRDFSWFWPKEGITSSHWDYTSVTFSISSSFTDRSIRYTSY